MSKHKRISFRVTANDKKEIMRLSEVLGYRSVSDYLYSISLSGLSMKESILIFNQIHKMRSRNAMVENNINQIAKYVNIHKSLHNDKKNEFLILFQEFILIRENQTKSINLLLNSIRDNKKELYDMLNKEKNNNNRD